MERKTMRWRVKMGWLSDWSYGISALIGVLTYFVYGALNHAWKNPVLVGIALYMFLSIPWYSRISNALEAATQKATRSVTIGRIARYLLQVVFNIVLLWVFIAGRVIDPHGLRGVGGFFATAAWITAASQGTQYLAVWLGQYRVGTANRNVVLAIFISVFVNALAVSGIKWIQPAFVTVSMSLGAMMIAIGMISDAKSLLNKAREVSGTGANTIEEAPARLIHPGS